MHHGVVQNDAPYVQAGLVITEPGVVYVGQLVQVLPQLTLRIGEPGNDIEQTQALMQMPTVLMPGWQQFFQAKSQHVFLKRLPGFLFCIHRENDTILVAAIGNRLQPTVIGGIIDNAAA